ncbi:MAG: hypothetical protein ACRECO_19520 [Xanthobacteraceae bacterium]
MADAKECRQRALRCAELAHSTKACRLRELLLDLTRTWLKLALELERTEALLDDDFLVLGFRGSTATSWSESRPRNFSDASD